MTGRMRSRLARMSGGIVVGACLALLFDPIAGKRRRHMLRDRTLALARRGERRGRRLARHGLADAEGYLQRRRHREEEAPAYDDTTLARKVETEIFRWSDAPKGAVVVNAVGGIVALRGEVDSSEEIARLVNRAAAVHGVKGVENLLHLPGTPAPMHQ